MVSPVPSPVAGPGSIGLRLTLPSAWRVLDRSGGGASDSADLLLVAAHGAAAQAFAVGASRAAVLQHEIGEHRISATMMQIPVAGGRWPVEQLIDVARMAYPAGGVTVVSIGLDLAGVRVQEHTERVATIVDVARTVPLQVVRFLIPSPVDGYVLVEFATPVVVLADRFVRLFDQIADTARWVAVPDD